MKKLLLSTLFLSIIWFGAIGQMAGSGNAFDFTFSSISVPDDPSLDSPTMTIEAWIKADSWGTNIWENVIVSKDGWAFGEQGYTLRAGANGSLSFNLGISGGWREVTSAPTMNTGQWYHVAGTYDGTTMLLYINGMQVGNTTFNGAIDAGAYNLTFGQAAYTAGGTRDFDGNIDEIKIWGSALSQSDIQDYMCKKVTASHPAYANLIGYWNFDDTGIVLDQTANGNNGTNFGGTQVASGAPIGDESEYVYGAIASLAIESVLTDSMTVETAGVVDGIHLYRVDLPPNNTVTSPNIIGFDQTHYYGAFPVNAASTPYIATYYSGANNYLSTNPNFADLVGREDGSSTPWTEEGSNFGIGVVSLGKSYSDRRELTVGFVCPIAFPLPFSEEFESGLWPPLGVSILNPDFDDTWALSTAVSGFGVGSACTVMDNFTNDLRGTSDRLVLPNLSAFDVSTVILEFDVAYARYSSTLSDSLSIGVSTDCGETFTEVYFKGGSDLATAPDVTTEFLPSANQWRTESVDLSAYDGNTSIVIAFDNVAGYGQPIFVDNINVSGGCSDKFGTDVISACESYVWRDGITYNADNNTATYTEVGVAFGGCDSIITLDLSIQAPNTGTHTVSAVESYTWIDGNTYTEANNSATFTETNVFGCDSVVTLDLTIVPGATGTGGELAPTGTTAGVVTFTAEASGIVGSILSGGTCGTGATIADVNVPAILGYNTAITSITLFDVVHSFAADLDLRLISPAGTIFTFNLDNGGSTGLDDTTDVCFNLLSADCADTWTSSLSPTQPENCMLFETTEDVCGPITADYTFNCGVNTGEVVGELMNGTWTLEVTDDAGGDTGSFTSFSIAMESTTPPATDSQGTTIDLLSCCCIPSTGTDTRTECAGYTWIDGITYSVSNNSATHNLTGQAESGCDSIVTLDLTITDVDVSTTSQDPTVTANAAPATYHCNDNNSGIEGANGQSYVALVNGSYAVEVTQDGCVDTSDCVTIITVGISESDFGGELSLYPNPTRGNVSINLGQEYDDVLLNLYSIEGKLLESQQLNQTQRFDYLLTQATGMYLLSITADDKTAVIRVVKE